MGLKNILYIENYIALMALFTASKVTTLLNRDICDTVPVWEWHNTGICSRAATWSKTWNSTATLLKLGCSMLTHNVLHI